MKTMIPLTCPSSGLVSLHTQLQRCQATYQKETDLINLDVIKVQGKPTKRRIRIRSQEPNHGLAILPMA